MFILASCENWEFRAVNMYGFEYYTFFLGKKISFDLIEQGMYEKKFVLSLFMEDTGRIIIQRGSYRHNYYFFSPEKGIIKTFDTFIKQNL